MKIYRMITLYDLNYKLYMKSGRELEIQNDKPYSLHNFDFKTMMPFAHSGWNALLPSDGHPSS